MIFLSRQIKSLLLLTSVVFLSLDLSAQDYYKIFDYQFEYAPESTYDNEPNNTLDLVENAVNWLRNNSPSSWISMPISNSVIPA